MIFNVKYSIGSTVYFPVYSKADLIKASVIAIIPDPIESSYRVRFTRDYIDTDLVAKESELLSFTECKQALILHLQNRIQYVNNIVEE